MIAAAAAVAIAAFVLLKPEDEDEGASRPGTTQAESAAAPEARAPSAPKPPPEEIRIRDGKVLDGLARIEVRQGDPVRIVVTSDAADEVHLHGYDIGREVAPGKPARFSFRADTEGVFEIESHAAEDAGRDPLLGRLVVSPR